MYSAWCEIRAASWFASEQVTGDKGRFELGKRAIRIMFPGIFQSPKGCCGHLTVN